VGPIPLVFQAANQGQLPPPLKDFDRKYVDIRLGAYKNQKNIHISLDSVVFEDGELIGPDRANSLGTMNA
jgi:hypothetical protein